ncbi:MAG TPA: response regulator [Methanobacterium sp.]|nr:response regulator [Methanobacterium sp.]
MDKIVNILLVEDNPADARLIEEVFKDISLNNKIYIVKDGVDAINFLYNLNDFKEAPRPDIILLDLNLPRKDGREVLKEIKGDENLKSIPIVILTTSSAREDIIKTYRDRANCYVTKPVDFDEFFKVITAIEDFWLRIVKLN